MVSLELSYNLQAGWAEQTFHSRPVHEEESSWNCGKAGKLHFKSCVYCYSPLFDLFNHHLL